jgi:hypothetical protein
MTTVALCTEQIEQEGTCAAEDEQRAGSAAQGCQGFRLLNESF